MYKNKSRLLATLISVYFIKNMYLYQKITAIAIDAAVWFIFAYFKKAEKWLEWICIRYASGNYTLEGVVLVAVLQVCSKN